MGDSLYATIAQGVNPLAQAGQAVNVMRGMQDLRTQQFALQQAKLAPAYSGLMALRSKGDAVTYDDIIAANATSQRLGADVSGLTDDVNAAMARGETPGDYVRSRSIRGMPAWEQFSAVGGLTGEQLMQPIDVPDPTTQGRSTIRMPMGEAIRQGLWAPPMGYGGAGAPPARGGAGVPAAAPAGAVNPFIAPNLPQGISPAEDQMVRTVYGEAANEPQQGQIGVASVIRNRMRLGNQNAQDVIFAPGQFEPWGQPEARSRMQALDPNSPQYQSILNNVVRPVMAGNTEDPTQGATNFYAPALQRSLGRNVPAWATPDAHTVDIGGHSFYRVPGYAPVQVAGPGAPTQPATPATPPPAPFYGQGGGVIRLPPPGTPEMVAGATGRATGLQAQLQSSIQMRPMLQGMEDELDTMIKSGVGARVNSTLRQTLVNAGFVNQAGQIAENQAAQEQFNKFAQIISGQTLAQLGNASNDRQTMAQESNPGLELSYLGNKGILHMLEGQQQAVQVMGRAWQAQLDQGASPGSFDKWRNEFTAPDAQGGRFDPRVFWMANMTGDEQKTYFRQIQNPAERASLLRNMDHAERQGWITAGEGGGITSPY